MNKTNAKSWLKTSIFGFDAMVPKVVFIKTL